MTFSYILVILATLIIVGLLFGFLAQAYAERQAKLQLIKDANAILDMVIDQQNSSDNIGTGLEKQLRKTLIAQVGGLESRFVLLSRDLKVLYPKNEEAEQFKVQVLPKIENRLGVKTRRPVTFKIKINGQDNIVAVIPPRRVLTQGLGSWVVLYEPVAPVQKLIRSTLFVLLISLLIAALIAVAAGIFVARTIAKPVIKLKSRAEAVSRLDFDGEVDINTGDELEELAKSINKMASELKNHDISQKRFFQNASHELKTPLMSIQGYAEGLKDGVFDKDSEALDVIVEESKRLKGIVEELIYLSKIESQEDLYKFSQENINDVVEKVLEKVKGLSAKGNININLALYKDAKINMDRDKMTQALLNIIGNCIRYAANQVEIVTATSGRWFEITVADDGEGFAENEAGKVFERFYKGKKGGSGLGLAITKAIVERHNGTISAVNRLEGGALFLIRLPVSQT